MEEFTIAIYCFFDDLLQKLDPMPIDKRRKLTDAQVITTATLAAKYFYGNQAAACGYFEVARFSRTLFPLSLRLELHRAEIAERGPA